MSERDFPLEGQVMLMLRLTNMMTIPIKAIIEAPVIIEDGDSFHLH
jgi:hypothetical protein